LKESGGGGTPMELFLAGLEGWDAQIRQKLLDYLKVLA
jgi:hypothetical protein